jgi:disulfide bond formation protein DsbB
MYLLIVQIVNILAFLVVIALITVIIFWKVFACKFALKHPPKICHNWFLIIKEKSLLLAFIFSLFALVGSLFFSEIAKFAPCLLCWYQRICMYPLVLILGIGYFKKDKGVVKYAIPLSIIGLLIGTYHYTIQMIETYFHTLPPSLVPCGTIGMTASCTHNFFLIGGFITIPFMSMATFLMITSLLFFYNKKIK